MSTKLATIITEALIEQLASGNKVIQVWHLGLCGWYADIEFYHHVDNEWYNEECMYLGYDIDRALENIANNTTKPPLKDLGL